MHYKVRKIINTKTISISLLREKRAKKRAFFPRKKLNDHAKATSQMSPKVTFEIKKVPPALFSLLPKTGTHIVNQLTYFQRGYSLPPFQPNKRQGWERSSQRKGSEFLLLFKKLIFFPSNVFFPLDENTEEAGVTEVADLSKDVAKPIQNPNVTHQTKAFTYDILKTLCSATPLRAVGFELCGFTTEPRRL